jgi:hypothetical protein
LKIQRRKIAMQSLRGLIANSGGCLSRFKTSEMLGLSFERNVGDPFSDNSMKMHAYKTALIGPAFPPIAGVLETRRPTNVELSIIQRIVISMVDSRSRRHHGLMHIDKGLVIPMRVSHCIKSTAVIVPFREPIKFGHALEIFLVHDSDLVLSERNKTVRFVEWLGNDGTPHRVSFGHESSVKGFALPGHSI